MGIATILRSTLFNYKRVGRVTVGKVVSPKLRIVSK
jgi:hypothetical protein